ncbi:MAG: DUF1211 domain-containing protein [Streptosporangiaceae bacterium]|nr:DUF1211 domain-containing protein [Streptosporangiaceae bacterium]
MHFAQQWAPIGGAVVMRSDSGMQSSHSKAGGTQKLDQGQAVEQPEDDEDAGKGIGRILALSDGVFAIALTLLILDISLPAATGDTHLPHALLRLWPRYLAYALSFLVIARFWMAHHLIFRSIAGFDTTLVWLNFLWLMFVAFMPFPTAVLGEHGNVPAAATLYAASVVLTSAASAASWWYASGKGGLLRPEMRTEQVKLLRAQALWGPVFFGLTVPIAVFAPKAAELIWVVGFLLFRRPFVRLIAGKLNEPGKLNESVNPRTG